MKRMITNSSMNGHWYGEGKMENGTGTMYVDLTIDENVAISIFNNGKVERIGPFSSTAHWVGQFLMFMDKPRFFIKYANEKQLVFGELESPGNFNGPSKWILTFNRVA